MENVLCLSYLRIKMIRVFLEIKHTVMVSAPAPLVFLLFLMLRTFVLSYKKRKSGGCWFFCSRLHLILMKLAQPFHWKKSSNQLLLGGSKDVVGLVWEWGEREPCRSRSRRGRIRGIYGAGGVA